LTFFLCPNGVRMFVVMWKQNAVNLPSLIFL
jgi:hypothetical protein